MSTAENEDNVPGKTSDGFAIPRPLIRMEETTRTSDGSIDPADAEHQDVPSLTLEYEPPRWSDVPENSVKFEVIKEGCIIETTDDMKKPYIVLGRHPTNDWILYHESISRKHAVLQFRKDGVAYLYDLGSTHGSFINKKRIIPRVHSVVYPGDILKFGSSSRMYVMIAKEINPLYVEDTLVKNLQAAADGQARRGLDISGEISEKTAASMLLEIRDLCSSLDQEFNVEVGSIPHDNNGPLYYGHAEIHVGSLTEEAETVEAEGVSPSRKEAHRKVIIGIYTKLRDAGAFSALKARNTQQGIMHAFIRIMLLMPISQHREFQCCFEVAL